MELEKLIAEQKALIEKVRREKRKSFTAAEEAEYQKRQADIERLMAKAEEEREQELKERFFTEALNETLADEKPATPEMRTSNFSGEGGKQVENNTLASSEELHTFSRYLRGQEVEKRYLGTAQQGGGATIPAPMYKKIVEQMSSSSALRKVVGTEQISAGIIIPVALTAEGRGQTTQEGELIIKDTEDVFTMVQPTVKKQTYAIPVSDEMVQDTAFDLEGFLMRFGGKALAHLEERDHLASDSQFSQQITNEIIGGKPDGLDADELIDTQNNIGSQYHNFSSWIVSGQFAGLIQKLKDGQGRYYFDNELLRGDRQTLLGSPLYRTDVLPAVAANNRVAYFGDWDYALLGLVGGIKILVDPYSQGPNGMIVYQFSQRTSLLSLLPSAFTAFKMGATP